MNAILKRMFEDDDCSKEEANLKAAILGKTYDECKVEWSRQFKKEFILANIQNLRKFDFKSDAEGKMSFVLRMHHYDFPQKHEISKHKIFKCADVQCTLVNHDQYGTSWLPNFELVVSFSESEIDAEFFSEVENILAELR